MKKLRRIENADLYVGNTLYNKNGTPRVLKTTHPKCTFVGSGGAWYNFLDLLDGRNGWKVECYDDLLLETIKEAVDSNVLSGYTYKNVGGNGRYVNYILHDGNRTNYTYHQGAVNEIANEIGLKRVRNTPRQNETFDLDNNVFEMSHFQDAIILLKMAIKQKKSEVELDSWR